jgi:hypothetical protein
MFLTVDYYMSFVCLNVNSKRDLNVFWQILPKSFYSPQPPLPNSPRYRFLASLLTQVLESACTELHFSRDSIVSLLLYKAVFQHNSHKPRRDFTFAAHMSRYSNSKSYTAPQACHSVMYSIYVVRDGAIAAPPQALRVRNLSDIATIIQLTAKDQYQTLATIYGTSKYYIVHQPNTPLLDNYVNTTFIGGGNEIEIIRNNKPSHRGSWCPKKTFPVVRSNHPLDVACGSELLQQIQRSCKEDPTEIVARHPTHPLLVVSGKDIRRLLSYSSPILDSIMSLYLEKLTLQYGISYLATSFLYTLRSQGWPRLLSYFALYRNRPRSNSRPLVQGESAIILPCFLSGCHWVVVVRREI